MNSYGAQTILVTGAGSGFGAAIVRCAAMRGHNVVAGMRELRAGEPFPFSDLPNVRAVSMDVTDEAACQAAAKAAAQTFGGIDVLVCNAGVNCAGAFEDTPTSAFRAVLETNLFGAINSAKAALPYMRSRRSGHIIVMSSLSALIGLPGDAVYAASRFAIEGAFEALAHEVGAFGVKVTLVRLGAYRTRLAERTTLPAGYPSESPYAPLIDHLAGGRSRSGGGADPADAAMEIVALMESPPSDIRVQIGDQAREVAAKLQAMNEAERQQFARDVADTHWWAEGRQKPMRQS